MPVDREFLVMYDYSTGAVWGLAHAADEAQIRRYFPQLEIVDERPAWMDAQRFEKLRAVSEFTVSDPDTYPEWLTALR
jgi:hypothetical protein